MPLPLIDFFGRVLMFNNGVVLQWGHYLYQHTFGSHGGSGMSFNVTFPITFNRHGCVTACVRNNTQFCVGVEYKNNSTIMLGVQSHSNVAQSIWGVYWMANGY